MKSGYLRTLIQRLQQLNGGRPGEPVDSELLERWVNERDQAVFEVLVWRYGTLVLNVCRRVLRREQDVEDAFQATFMALMRKAGSISKRDCVASWLYKVAYRNALEAAGRNRRHPQPAIHAEVAAPVVEDDWQDVRPVLDEEVNRLPPKYRRPFVSCYLEGKSTDEAAAELGCPRGTVATRLAWARERLRTRLVRRGVTLASGALAAMLSQHAASASLERPLVATTVQAIVRWSQGAALTGSAARASVLAQAVLGQMQMAHVKVGAMFIVLVGILVVVATALTYRANSGPLVASNNVPSKDSENLLRPVGDVVAVSPDGRRLTVRDYHNPERLFTLQFTDTTRETYRVHAPNEARPVIGYRIVATVDKRAPERALGIWFRGDIVPFPPGVAGTLTQVAPDGQSITITPRSRDKRVPEPWVIRIGTTTNIKFSGVGEGQDQLVPGWFSVWAPFQSGDLRSPLADRVDLSPLLPTRPMERPPTYTAAVLKYDPARRLLTLHFRNDRRPAWDVPILPGTTVVFDAVGPGGAHFTKGMEAEVWCTDEARQNVERIKLTPLDPRRTFSGRVVGVSPDGRRLTIQNSEGKTTLKEDVLLHELAEVVYRDVHPGGAHPKMGQVARVWFKEKSPDKVDAIWLSDPTITGSPGNP